MKKFLRILAALTAAVTLAVMPVYADDRVTVTCDTEDGNTINLYFEPQEDGTLTYTGYEAEDVPVIDYEVAEDGQVVTHGEDAGETDDPGAALRDGETLITVEGRADVDLSVGDVRVTGSIITYHYYAAALSGEDSTVRYLGYSYITDTYAEPTVYEEYIGGEEDSYIVVTCDTEDGNTFHLYFDRQEDGTLLYSGNDAGCQTYEYSVTRDGEVLPAEPVIGEHYGTNEKISFGEDETLITLSGEAYLYEEMGNTRTTYTITEYRYYAAALSGEDSTVRYLGYGYEVDTRTEVISGEPVGILGEGTDNPATGNTGVPTFAGVTALAGAIAMLSKKFK